MNSDADCVVKPIKQLIQLSLGEVADFLLRTGALDKQLQYQQIICDTPNNITTVHPKKDNPSRASTSDVL